MAAPVAYALNEIGIRWGSALVSVGAIAGLTTGVLVLLGSESRLIYSISREGLLPAAFSKVSRRKVPDKAIICTWALGCVLAGFFPIDMIAELCNIGTLWAFVFVAITVISLRKRHPELPRDFKVPAVPFIPVAAVVLCGFLAIQLDWITWAAFFAWTLFGFLIYFGYGRKHSRLGRQSGESEGTKNS